MKLLSMCSHQNIVAYKDSFLCGFKNAFCIVMEYCEGLQRWKRTAVGGNLADRIDKYREKGTYIPEETVCKWFADIASGLRYMHDLGIVHRDIKPANILADRNNVMKIGDFGITEKMIKTYLSHGGCTEVYASPEILDGSGKANESGDIWSLGCVLYEICAQKVGIVSHLLVAGLP